MPKGYIIGHMTVTDPAAYQELIDKDTPIFTDRYGGEFKARGGHSETPEGPAFERHVIIEFKDYDTARAAYYDPEYQALAEIRRRHADSAIVLVEGT